MSKLIFERRKENQANNKKNLLDKSNDKDSSSFIDKSNISESVFNVKEEYNTSLKDLDEYKKEIDRIFLQKKSKLDSAFEFQEEEEDNDDMEQKYEEELEEEIKKEKIKLEAEYEKKKKNLEEDYNKKTEKEKERIKKEVEGEYDTISKIEKSKNEEIINELNEDILKLEKELDKLREDNKNAINANNNLNMTDEIKKYEKKCEEELKEYQEQLDEKLEKKKKEINEMYEKKKNDFEKNLQAEQEKNREKELKEKMGIEENMIQNKKNMISKSNEVKLEHYKNNLISEYNKNTEKEKKDILQSFQKEINLVKENFEQTKNFYEQQKLLFQTEQSAINASSFLDKMKHVIENKSNVFKNLMEQNYFILKKKLKECDDLKELDNFSNKEAITKKISGLLNMIFYSNIYETLYQDMLNEKDLLGKYLDDLIEKCEAVIATLNTDKKIQLGMCICDPNFN